MVSVTGMVDHIIYRNEENGYTVFIMKSGSKELTCVGTAPDISEGEYLRADGEYTEHQTYGKQLKISALAVEIPEDEFAIERYLGSGVIKGVGPSLSGKIVEKFGRDTFRIIEEEPERLAEVKGISARKAADIYQQFHARTGMRQAMMYMARLGITTNLSLRIYKQYGEKVYTILAQNPYQLAEDMTGVGFKQADEIAKNAGLGLDSGFRIRSGILYIMQQAAQAGHTCLPLDRLTKRAADMLDASDHLVDEQLQSLVIDRKVTVRKYNGTDMVYLAIYYFMEMDTAARLARLNISCQIDREEALSRISKIEKNENILLDGFQKDAVIKAAQKGVVVITGGPGTGKTTTINAIIDYFEMEGLDIMLAAPTGRAAKRMAEAAGHEARTIHRLLEVAGAPQEEQAGPMHFERNEDNPLEADVIVIDEMSMVDLALMHSLLKAIPEGTRLIMVGDVDQLPSVGPGRVLADIIDSGCFEVVALTKIFRQALESDIVKNAHKINVGRQISLDNKSRDFFCIRRDDVMSVLGVVVALVRDKLPGYVGVSPGDIQVLTPMRKGELGVERLNKVLQRYLNPPSPGKKEQEMHQTLFREGDKVMQIKNNYQIEWEIEGKYNIPVKRGMGVFNGDIGVIRSINHFAQIVTVEFDEGRMVDYGFAQMDELELAYAVTIHKSQGSEYPAVVMPLLAGPSLLMNRNILYTAVTRARKCVAIVGSPDTVAGMIENESQQKRYSTLGERLRECC